MTRTLNRLSDAQCRTAKGPRTLSDGGHLSLQIDAKGNRRWLFIHARGGRQRETSIGPYPAVSLSDARKKRDAYNTALQRGEPIAGPRQQSGETFGAIAKLVTARKAKSWRGSESARSWGVSLERHCAKLLDRPIAAITQEDILRILGPLHESAPSFAPITAARIAEVFDYASARGLVPQDRHNPADRRRLAHLLPKRPAAAHRPALAYADVPALISELRAVPLANALVVAARALEFTILTGLRSGEACGALLTEIDVDRALFTVPADRMKTGREHQVPLSDRAIDIVRELEPLRGDDGVVFPAQRKASAIDGEQLLKLLRHLRPGLSVHGFRSSLRDWAGDKTTFPREIAEAVLAHTIGGVEGAYRRGDALDKRRLLMDAWSRFCGGEDTAKVIALYA